MAVTPIVFNQFLNYRLAAFKGMPFLIFNIYSLPKFYLNIVLSVSNNEEPCCGPCNCSLKNKKLFTTKKNGFLLRNLFVSLWAHWYCELTKFWCTFFRKELEEFAIKSRQEKELKRELEEKVSTFNAKMYMHIMAYTTVTISLFLLI